MNDVTIGEKIDGKTVVEVEMSFPVGWSGWELDYRGWVVQFDDGTKAIILSNHGSKYIASKDELQDKIDWYQSVIFATKSAMDLVDE